MAEDPPTRMDAAPNFSASLASFTEDLMLETSESINTKIIGPFFLLEMSDFSTFPLIPTDRDGIFKVLF